jgi:dTDP-4-dehydrorhamnose reductase
MIILVSGKGGQLAQSVQNILEVSSEHEFIFLDKKVLDVSDANKIEECFNIFKPNIFINTAAYTKVDDCEEHLDLAFRINSDGPSLLSKFCLKFNTLLIHISTDYVFDGESNIPYKINDDTNPMQVYGRSKLKGEELIKESGCAYLIIRTSWLFSENGRNFVKIIANKIYEGESISVVGDQRGNPTYAVDLAISLIDLVKRNSLNSLLSKKEVIHYSGPDTISWFDFANTIYDTIKSMNLINSSKIPTISSISSTQIKQKAYRPRYSGMDLSSLDSFNLRPSNWRRGVEKTIIKSNE